jgi:hypothetical protein
MLAAPARTPPERRHKAEVRQELRKQERKRQMQGWARVHGVTTRTIGIADGLSRDYTWGPDTFVVDMAVHDIERLMQLHPLHRQAFTVHDTIVVVRS